MDGRRERETGGSLFRKVFLFYAGVLTAVVLVFSSALSALTTNRLYEDRRKALGSAATMVGQTMREYLAGTLGFERLASTIDMIGYIADARIYAVRYDKASLAGIAAQLADTSAADATLVADLGTLLEGRTVFHSRNYSAKLDTDVVLAGYPLSDGTGIIGGILMYAPLDEVSRAIVRTNLILGAIALGALLVGTFAIWLLTRGIVRPIRDMQAAAVRLASGEATEPVPVTTKDEIGRLARAFNHMQAQLARTEEVRRGFIANVSHELRTPLTSIQGFLQGMLDGVIRPEDTREHLQRMMDEVRRLGKLTGEILDLAKLQSGTTLLVKEPVDLRALACDTAASLEGLLGGKRLHMTVAAGEPVPMYADADRIRQVLVNLLGNAIKFTPEDGAIVVMVCREGADAVLRVRDNGIGIPEEELPLVFEKFHRVDRTGNPAYGGSGLGLNIARTIVDLHRGSIRAARLPEGGTEFTVRLPES